MFKKLPSLVLLVGVISTLVAMPLATYAQAPGAAQAQNSTTFPIEGTGVTGTGLPADFKGTFDISKFDVVDNKLVAIGKLAGAVNVAGVAAPVPVPERDVTIPVISINGKSLPTAGVATDADDAGDLRIAQAASCDILNLVLGPLQLDLLGLVVDLNQLILNITGQTGAGNLVGNLLCAITGLLDRTGTLTIIANLLNSILDILNLP